MSFSLFSIFEAAILAIILSIDVFVSAFAYGSDNIKIPMSSAWIINIICSVMIAFSFMVGTVIKPFIPSWLTAALCFGILFIIGSIKLLDGVIKSMIRKNEDLNKEIKFSVFSLKFIICLYADPERADADNSKVLSPIEAVTLAFATSMDGLALGLGAAFGNINGIMVSVWSLVTAMAAIILGCYLGKKVVDRFSFDLSWLGGAVLIVLAISKLF